MWGNIYGWLLAGVIVLFTCILGEKFIEASSLTPPTSLSSAANLAPIDLPIPHDLLLQNAPGNAGEDYQAALKSFDETTCDNFMRAPNGPAPECIQHVLDATHKSQMQLFLKDPSEIVDYNQNPDPIVNLETLGTKIIGASMVLRKNHKDAESDRYIDAALALGLNLYHERVNYPEYSRGFEMITLSLQEMGQFVPEGSAKRSEYQTAGIAIRAYNHDHVDPIIKAILSVDQDSIAKHAGDIYRFATHSKDRMIRVEAILKLGRYRFDSIRAIDQTKALPYIDKFVDDPDPAVSTAARVARDLTIEGYRSRIHF